MNDFVGKGFTGRQLSEPEIHTIVAGALEKNELTGKRVLVIIPDNTRSAKTPLFFRLFYEKLSDQTAALDYLIALGTHPPLDQTAIHRLLGLTSGELAARYPRSTIFNHNSQDSDALHTLGTISREETSAFSKGMLDVEIPIRINRLVLEYDAIIICGPVFPHEVAGFSGGNKYFFPGVSGPELISFTHWLGAMITSYSTMGVKDTLVRQIIDRAAALLDRPKLCFCQVMQGKDLYGLFAGSPGEAWEAAADLSACINIQQVEHPYRQVLSIIPTMYPDMWTAAKGMYKVDPVVADGGEVILYAPHITEFSYTYGSLIDRVGYHVNNYFIKQWDRYKRFPWGVLAHSTPERVWGV